MGRRKRTALASIDNLKKNKDENPTKKQKLIHPQPTPGKENANVSSVARSKEQILTEVIIECTYTW
jgi:hypothetical protein